MAPGQDIYPWETRDVDDQAEAYYNQPLRTKNQVLLDENRTLKVLLRQNGISWSTVAQNYQRQVQGPSRLTRSSMSATTHSNPHLPMEVLLRILKYALTSPEPIIDPLWKRKPENLTADEATSGNQIAIHFLATSRLMHAEGTRILWEANTFIFTTHEAVRNMAELDPCHRQKIKRLTFRIVARYYDDKKRAHRLDRSYHPSLKKDVPIRVNQRIDEHTHARSGFRCYTWSQITDFLRALRAPHDPQWDKKLLRPRLFPCLESLRLDLVNFMNDYLPICGVELHDMASHELGCSLNELQVTGLPLDEAGGKASAELTGLLKDEGLYITSYPAFVQVKNVIRPLSAVAMCARVVRAWKTEIGKATAGLNHAGGSEDADDDDDEEDDEDEDYDGGYHVHHNLGPKLPPAPKEEGHPTSFRNPGKTIWKRVPTDRDGETRKWVEFCRSSGDAIEDGPAARGSNAALGTCRCCGGAHGGNTILGMLLASDGDN